MANHPYVDLPLRIEEGRLATTSRIGSIRNFIGVVVGNAPQLLGRPAWLPADPGFGCDIPQYRFATERDAFPLQSAVEQAVRGQEARLTDVRVVVSPPEGAVVRRRTMTITGRVAATGEPFSLQFVF